MRFMKAKLQGNKVSQTNPEAYSLSYIIFSAIFEKEGSM